MHTIIFIYIIIYNSKAMRAPPPPKYRKYTASPRSAAAFFRLPQSISIQGDHRSPHRSPTTRRYRTRRETRGMCGHVLGHIRPYYVILMKLFEFSYIRNNSTLEFFTAMICYDTFLFHSPSAQTARCQYIGHIAGIVFI